MNLIFRVSTASSRIILRVCWRNGTLSSIFGTAANEKIGFNV